MHLVPYMEWIIPAPLLFAIAWVRFNQPPTNRSGTTFALFSIGLLIYCLLVAVLWLLVIIVINQGSLGFDKIHLVFGWESPQARAEFAQYAPLLAALVMVAATQIEWVREIDNSARDFCITLAAIPREADRLTLELARIANFHPRSERLRDKISQVIRDNVGAQALSFESNDSLQARFTRAVGLYWLFVGPNNNEVAANDPAAYARIMQLGEATVTRLAERYKELMEAGLAYFIAPHPTKELEEPVDRSINEVSLLTCSLIARYVLYASATESKRRLRLSNMGFNASGAIWTFGADQWVTTILAVIVLSAAMMAFMPGTLPLASSHILRISITFGLSIGFAVIAGVWVAQRSMERHNGEIPPYPPIAELTLAALIVAGLSAALRIAVALIPALIQGNEFAISVAIAQFLERWPGIIIPFACTISQGLLCTYLGARRWNQLRVAAIGALGNGIAFLAAAVMVGWLLSDDVLAQFYKPEAHARLLVLINTTLIGFVIGAMVLWQFKRSERARLAYAVQAAKASRVGVPPLAALRPPGGLDPWTPKAPGVAAHSYGGYSHDEVKSLVGAYVCFRPGFTASGVISAYRVDLHWDKEASCLTFDERDREDSTHTQRGRVYLPDDRPFMSFVTVEGGAIRLIMVSRPTQGEPARGLIMTLSNPIGTQFTPACAPIVFRRLAPDEKPRLGFIRAGAPDYESYRRELAKVSPQFGLFAPAPPPASSAEATFTAEEPRLAVVT